MSNSSIVASTADRLLQAFCAMRGHDSYLFFEQDRMYLRCASCGHESPGWAVGKTHAQIAEPAQRPIVRVPLLGTRRAV